MSDVALNPAAISSAVETPGAPVFPGDEKATIEKWNVEINKAKRARVPFEREWYLNIAFISGRQWVQWDASIGANYAGQLVERKIPDGRVRVTVNLTRKLINMQHSKLCKERVRGYISPATPDDEDIAAARAGEKLNDYLIELTKLSDRLNRADWWMLSTGTGFVKDWYNPDISMSGEAQEDPMTGEKVPSKVFGAPVVETVSPFHILVPNLDEPDLDNQEWVCHVTVKTAKAIQEQWKVHVEGEENLASTTVEAKLQSAQGFKASENKRGMEVKELWVKPCTDYPDGMVLTWTKDRILSFLPAWPYSHGEYPFAKRQFIETGRFYGESTVTDLRPLQVEYNKTRSQIIEDKNLMARPMMAVQQGSVNVNAIKGRAGEMVIYKPGTPPPAPIPMQGIPNYVVEHLKHLQEEMRDIASQQVLEQGVPSGVTAATAISYIQENQDSILNETLRNKETVYERICRHLLSYVVQYWDAQRQIKVVGENQNFEAFLLGASDLRGNTDWRVVSGSATPQSHAGKQALITELMKMGAIPVDRALQFLDLGDTSRLFEEMQVDVREAERQNLKMSKGVPAETADWQNLLVHIQVHDNYRKREEFDNLDDQIKAIFRHHVFMDMYLLAKQMGTVFPPEVQMMLMQQTQIDPFFVEPMLEENLRAFVVSLQSGVGAANPAQSDTASQPPR